ncbi:hypothetical protein Tco_0026380 [Tanacetum coccineum]
MIVCCRRWGEGEAEKQHSSANDSIKDTVLVSSAVDELDSGNFVLSTANEVTKEFDLIEKPKSLVSFAKLVTGESSRKSVNSRTLLASTGNGADVAISVESVRAISELFANIVYGFSLGKRVAYPVVANYVKNTWCKHGLVKSMLNSSNGLFFFEFGSKEGMDIMLENEDVCNVLVCIKFHGVPMITFSDDGLSVIATKIGTPFMLDSYTYDMCMQSWGRSSYAREMIELRAGVELKDTIVVAMPKLVGKGFYMCTIHIEYKWKPPKFSSCNVFGHVLDECPKNIISDV